MLDHVANEHTAGWTDDRIEHLKKRWKEGASASQIASELGGGVTRNGVIGKVSRLKLKSHGTNAPKAPKVKRTTAEVAEGKRQWARINGHGGQPKAEAIIHNLNVRKLPPMALPVEDGVDVTHLIGLMQLTDQTCRYPIGDPLAPGFGFCGDPTQQGSKYCSGHHKRVYYSI